MHHSLWIKTCESHWTEVTPSHSHCNLAHSALWPECPECWCIAMCQWKQRHSSSSSSSKMVPCVLKTCKTSISLTACIPHEDTSWTTVYPYFACIIPLCLSPLISPSLTLMYPTTLTAISINWYHHVAQHQPVFLVFLDLYSSCMLIDDYLNQVRIKGISCIDHKGPKHQKGVVLVSEIWMRLRI